MPTNNIIAEWLNLPSVKFDRVATHQDVTYIYLQRNEEFICSGCGQVFFVSWDFRETIIRDLPVFSFKAYLILYKHRTNCSICGVKTERLDFVDPYSRCTIRFEELVAMLCRATSVKKVAELLGLDWKTVKAIDKKYLEKQFAIPNYEGLRLLAVDEIASHKGYHFFTVVMDLERTRVILGWQG